VRTALVGLVLLAGCKAKLVGSCQLTAEMCTEYRGGDDIAREAPGICPNHKFREGEPCPTEHVVAACAMTIGPVDARHVFYPGGLGAEPAIAAARRTCELMHGTLDVP
jgi:hypothetical protein